MRIKSAFTLIFIILAACVSISARTPDEVPNVHVADRTRYVSDPDNILDSQSVARIDSLLGDIWSKTTAEPVVVVVNDLSGEDINDYATELFELWGIGKKDMDNGVLMVVSRDDRKAVIRTGYGVESILTDARCGIILRDVMFPAFRQGDYGKGISDGVNVLHSVMTDSDSADQLLSKYANDADANGGEDFFKYYLGIAAAVGIGMLMILAWTFVSTRRKTRFERYRALEKYRVVYLVLVFATIGFGLPALLLLMLAQCYVREQKCKCPNCGTTMNRLDEETDNLYLTPAQDTEERINSVDYDVWLCPNCGETDIIPYTNRTTKYSICTNCGSRAAYLESDRITRQPTSRQQGEGIKTYNCLNCNHRTTKRYKIPATASATPVIISGGRGFGGGGGFSGGSFGGGMTGGGGASGGW